MSTKNTTALLKLREAMKHTRTSAVDAYIVPSEDPHSNEDVPTCFQRRAFITGCVRAVCMLRHSFNFICFIAGIARIISDTFLSLALGYL